MGDPEREGDGGGSARCDRIEPLGPTGTRTPEQVPGPGSGGAPRAAGGFRGLRGTPVKATRADAAGSGGGRVCGDSVAPLLRVPGNSYRTSEARAPGAGSLNPPLKLAFGGLLWDPGPDVSAIQLQSCGDCAPQPRCVAGTGTVRGCGFARRGLPVHQK